MTRADQAPIPGTEGEPLERFLEGIRPRVKRVLRSYDIPPEDAEDILQEALLDAVRKWDTIQHMESWLLGTLGYKCSHYWRRQRSGRGMRVQAVDTAVLEELAQPQPPAQEREEVIHDLQRLMRGLGKKHQAALWLRFGLGLSTEEVARRLGYCSSSIRKLTTRSMARLHRWANGSEPSP